MPSDLLASQLNAVADVTQAASARYDQQAPAHVAAAAQIVDQRVVVGEQAVHKNSKKKKKKEKNKQSEETPMVVGPVVDVPLACGDGECVDGVIQVMSLWQTQAMGLQQSLEGSERRRCSSHSEWEGKLAALEDAAAAAKAQADTDITQHGLISVAKLKEVHDGPEAKGPRRHPKHILRHSRLVAASGRASWVPWRTQPRHPKMPCMHCKRTKGLVLCLGIENGGLREPLSRQGCHYAVPVGLVTGGAPRSTGANGSLRVRSRRRGMPGSAAAAR
jgi:hypothetical protein